jgi:hypothetical protein
MEPATVGTTPMTPENLFVTSGMTYLLVANLSPAGGATIFLGVDDTVSATTGYPIPPGPPLVLPLPTGLSTRIYLVATAADTPASVALTF